MTNKRTYNVFFHTHTVSGIVISIGLFVCFFAGAFALFQSNINKWEANVKNAENITVDYEKTLNVLTKEGYILSDRSIFIMKTDNPLPAIAVESRPLRPPVDSVSTDSAMQISPLAYAPISVKIDPDTYAIMGGQEAESSDYLGSFLLRLHFFDQIPKVGIYLSGLLSLFFLFAIVTGVIIHWKKMMSNFFTFRLKASIKNMWTDGHTALGIIGLPFQFMFAVTGAMLGLSLLVIILYSKVVFGGDISKMLGYIAPAYGSFESAHKPSFERKDINGLVRSTREELDIDQSTMEAINLTNYNDENAHLMVEFRSKGRKSFYDDAHITYKLVDGSIVERKTLDDISYKGSVLNTIRKLHFGEFGGYLLKAIYFILSMLTCYVILSGVMIWLEARKGKRYDHKRKYNNNVGAIYIGACMGLFPAIAFFFCTTKIFPLDIEHRHESLNYLFFFFWVGYMLYAFLIKDLYKINKHALLFAGVMGLAIPFLNGIQSGLWFWKSYGMGYTDSFFIDFSWLFLGAIATICAIFIRRRETSKKSGI